MKEHSATNKKLFTIDFNYTTSAPLDIVSKCKKEFKTGAMYLRSDNRIGVRVQYEMDAPWIYANIEDVDRQCVVYHDIFFPKYNLIHSRCLNCWKTVARPKTLLQLECCRRIQQKMTTLAKTGIEPRPYVTANYGAYWYSNTMEEGLQVRDDVRYLLSDMGLNDVPVFLKRGCTEFEKKFPDTDHWSMPEGQSEIERFLNDTLILEKDICFDPPFWAILHIERMWVEFAAQRGDETYKFFNGNMPLYPEYKKYEWEDMENDSICHYKLNHKKVKVLKCQEQ